MSEPLSDETLSEYALIARDTDYHNCDLPDAITALLAEVARLKASVQSHHNQRGDSRCHLDDLKLYHEALGLGDDPYVCALPPDADMEESCRRYIRQRRCPGVDVPLPGGMTIQQLTDETMRLVAENADLRREVTELTAALERQAQASFVAGMRAPDLDALALKIERVVRCCYPFGTRYDPPPEAVRAAELYRNRPDSVGIEEAQAVAVRTVVREMLAEAIGTEAET